MTYDVSDEDILVIVMIEQPELMVEMRAQHVPDRPRGIQHCRACPGVTQGRAVWPCGIRLAVERAGTLLALEAKAVGGREHLERDEGPLVIDRSDSASGPPRPRRSRGAGGRTPA